MSAQPAAARTFRDRLRGMTSPKGLISILITVILVTGEWAYGAIGGYDKLVLTLGTCVAVEAALGLFLVGRVPPLQSAYITGISLTLLLRPAGGLTWPFVVGAALAIGCKYVLRYRGRHLWNPSNFGICALLLVAPSRVAILSHELGNDLGVNAVIWVLGLLIAARARVLHVSVTYALSFAALAAARSVVTGSHLWTEIAPLTGPMYQLLVFFMVTDPRTTVSTRRGRILTVIAVAVGEASIRLANDIELVGAGVFAPAPALFALFIVGPVALWADLRRVRASRQEAPAKLPEAQRVPTAQ